METKVYETDEFQQKKLSKAKEVREKAKEEKICRVHNNNIEKVNRKLKEFKEKLKEDWKQLQVEQKYRDAIDQSVPCITCYIESMIQEEGIQ